MITHKRNARPAIVAERETRAEHIPYTPTYYAVITDSDYPVPIAWEDDKLVYRVNKSL